MSIWIVTCGHDGGTICGIFSTRAKADEEAASWKWPTIEERELDESHDNYLRRLAAATAPPA
jgi:hypothetical protein